MRWTCGPADVGARHGVEEAPRLGVVDHREELLELIDDDQEFLVPVPKHLGSARDQSVRFGESRGERPSRGRHGRRERSIECTEGMGARLHECDRDVRVVLSDSRDQTGLDGARLPGTARPDHSGEIGAVENACEESLDELLLTEEPSMIGLAERSQSEVRVLDPPIVCPTRRRWIRRRVEIRILQQDLFLESAQFGRRDDAEVLAEQVSSALKRTQCVRLTTGSVQRHHVERPESFTVWVFPCQSVEVGHNVAVLAGGESGVHHLLDGGQAEFRQPRHLHLESLTAADVVERRTPPECERIADRCRSARRIGR